MLSRVEARNSPRADAIFENDFRHSPMIILDSSLFDDSRAILSF